jgi:hypothetical protein
MTERDRVHLGGRGGAPGKRPLRERVSRAIRTIAVSRTRLTRRDRALWGAVWHLREPPSYRSCFVSPRDHRDARINSCGGNTRIPRKSLTLVSVGPVMI